MLAMAAALAASGVLGLPGVPGADSPVRTTASSETTSVVDVSYPQCDAPLPDVPAAIVGVNAGLPTNRNPCLVAQLAWADSLAAAAADVYVNTADPGHAASWWPTGDYTRLGTPVHGRYGACDGSESAACAYAYGVTLAENDATNYGVENPGARRWWLDVETSNSWGWDHVSNRAVLEGMTDYLQGIGARVGLYSTKQQWSLIIGGAPRSSPLTGLPTWRGGATTAAGAAELCAGTGLTASSRVAHAQWVDGGIDRDLVCH